MLYLPDSVDSFRVTSGPSFEGKPLMSVTPGAADLAAISLLDAKQEAPIADGATTDFIVFIKATLGEEIGRAHV